MHGNNYLDFDHAIKPMINLSLKLGVAYEGYRNGFQPKFGEEVGLALGITSRECSIRQLILLSSSFTNLLIKQKRAVQIQ